MKTNVIDRVVGYFSPEAGLRRARARGAVDMVQRAYEGARIRRENAGWTPPGASANADLRNALPMLRRRSRDLIQNSPWAKRAKDIVVANEVGTGIRPRSRTKSSRLNKRRMAAWKVWAETPLCDAESQLDIYGIQALVSSAVFESGDCLIRLRWLSSAAMKKKGLSVPLQLQVLESDYLCTAQDGITLPNGNQIVQGIELEPDGVTRAGYYLWKSHPGESYPHQIGWVRVPAEEILLIYRKDRPGQIRGVPRMHAVVNRLQDSADFEDAVQMRAKAEACVAMIVQQNGDLLQPAAVGAASTDEQGDTIESMSPGMVVYTRPGETVTSILPTASGGAADWVKHNLRAVAAGSGVCYDQISTDLTGANYSSLRAGRLEFRRLIEQSQFTMLIPMLCQPLYAAFCKAGFMAGLWEDMPALADWQPPMAAMVDPGKDTSAAILGIRAGLITLPQAIAAMGYDPEMQLAEIAESNELLDKLKILLDSDPRNLSQQGQLQAVASPSAGPDEENQDAEESDQDTEGSDSDDEKSDPPGKTPAMGKANSDTEDAAEDAAEDAK